MSEKKSTNQYLRSDFIYGELLAKKGAYYNLWQVQSKAWTKPNKKLLVGQSDQYLR